MTYNSSIDLERDANQQFQIDTRVENSRKSALIAYVLCLLFSGLGITISISASLCWAACNWPER